MRACKESSGPVLSICTGDTNRVYFGGAGENQATCWDLATNESYFMGAHDGPISCMYYHHTKNILVTGSWDKTVKFWDNRVASCVGSVTAPDKVFCSHLLGDSGLFATSNRKILHLDFRQTQRTRLSIACSPFRFDYFGFSVGTPNRFYLSFY